MAVNGDYSDGRRPLVVCLVNVLIEQPVVAQPKGETVIESATGEILLIEEIRNILAQLVWLMLKFLSITKKSNIVHLYVYTTARNTVFMPRLLCITTCLWV